MNKKQCECMWVLIMGLALIMDASIWKAPPRRKDSKFTQSYTAVALPLQFSLPGISQVLV